MSEASEAYVDAAVDDLPEDVDAVLLGHVLQTALDDVVAVGVGAQHGDVPAQRVHDHLHHVRLLADLDEALDAARAVDVVGRLHDLALHLHQLSSHAAATPTTSRRWSSLLTSSSFWKR